MTKEHFETLAEQYMDTIFRVAFTYTKSREDADDVTQEVLIRLYSTEKEFESDDHLKNWLIRVTVNCCKMLFRSPWRRTVPLEEYAESLHFDEKERTLFDAVMGLDRRYRVPILLHYYDGYTAPEIAELLRIPTNTVNTRLHRGRAKLREQLTEV